MVTRPSITASPATSTARMPPWRPFHSGAESEPETETYRSVYSWTSTACALAPANESVVYPRLSAASRVRLPGSAATTRRSS